MVQRGSVVSSFSVPVNNTHRCPKQGWTIQRHNCAPLQLEARPTEDQSFCALITTYYATHGVFKLSAVVVVGLRAYDSRLNGWADFKDLTQQTFWSLSMWVKCWSFYLFTTFTKSVYVPMYSRMHRLWNLLCSISICINTCQMPLSFRYYLHHITLELFTVVWVHDR